MAFIYVHSKVSKSKCCKIYLIKEGKQREQEQICSKLFNYKLGNKETKKLFSSKSIAGFQAVNNPQHKIVKIVKIFEEKNLK